MVLHKQSCYSILSHRSQYLDPINKAYNENFENLDQYKHKNNFERCLSKLTLDNVRNAIFRSKEIMANNKRNGLHEQEFMGFHYYQDNPSLTIWESIESILMECDLNLGT